MADCSGPKLIIFDMDGTLADTSPGIFDSIRHVAKEMGFKIPTDEELMQSSTGRLGDDFKGLWGINQETVNKALMMFAQYYEETGYLKSALYPGMKELLMDLRNAGHILSVATMKLEDCAIDQAKTWGISDLFDSINGADLFGKLTKTDLMERSMMSAQASPHESVMIGDTGNDLAGALNCGMRFIAVTYGFGFTREYCVSKGIEFAENSDGLRKLLL